MERPLDLDALASFDAVALHGGLGAAARATRRPKATLSRHLAGLEQALDVRLVERGERRLKLTEEGRELHRRAHGLLRDLADAAAAVASGGDEPRGTLRVSAPVVLAHGVLMPLATRFCRLHPNVTLELVAEDRRVDPVEDGYDVVVRIDPTPDERLVGRRIATDRRCVVAAPDVAPPLNADEIAVAGVVQASTPAGQSWRIRGSDGGVRAVVPHARLRLSSLLMVRDAALAGAGAALLPALLVAPDLAAGRLLLWGEADAPPVEIWALHASSRLASARVRAFLKALGEEWASA